MPPKRSKKNKSTQKAVCSMMERPDSLRPPCWRWPVILDHLAAKRDISLLMRDSALYAGAQFAHSMKARCRPTAAAKQARVAFWIYSDTSPGSKRWFLEAAALTRATDTEVASHLHGISPIDVRMYRRLFFDVEPYLHKPVEIVTKILYGSRAAASPDTEYDLIWKHFAYSFGLAELVRFIQKGVSGLTKEHKHWLKEFTSERQMIHACQVSQTTKMLYDGMGVELVRNAMSLWKLPEGSESGTPDSNTFGLNTQTRFVNSLSDALSMALISPDIELPAREDVIKTCSALPVPLEV
jgi:hypothetical protein